MTEQDLKPCPFCGSSNVEDDYDAVQPAFKGTRENPTGFHEYQNGWVDCNTCQAQGPIIRAKDEEIDNIKEMVFENWNKTPQPDWRDMESAPKDGRQILLKQPGSNSKFWLIGSWATASNPGLWVTNDGFDFDIPLSGPKPTRWMPLPGDTEHG